jgi:hypothetical protein
MNAHITLLCDTHTTTQQEIIDIKCVFQSYYMKKYILIHFEYKKKLIVVGLFLLLAGFRGLRPILQAFFKVLV